MTIEYKLIDNYHCSYISTYGKGPIDSFISTIKNHLSDGWELKGELYAPGSERYIHQLLIKNNTRTCTKVIDYTIVVLPSTNYSSSHTPEYKERIPNFNKLVNKYLSDKWELYGNTVFGQDTEYFTPAIYQVLVKYAVVEVNDLLELNPQPQLL
jgi:hypothetical protein